MGKARFLKPYGLTRVYSFQSENSIEIIVADQTSFRFSLREAATGLGIVNVCFWLEKKLFSGKSICARMGPVVERDKREVSRHERGGRL
jgi:hypothetical protein